jgi:hypothetical protein
MGAGKAAFADLSSRYDFVAREALLGQNKDEKTRE